MDLHIYTRELLDKHLLPELKEIAQGVGIIPEGNKTRRETWVAALVGQLFPVFRPIENSLDVDRAQEPIAQATKNTPGAKVAQHQKSIELLQQKNLAELEEIGWRLNLLPEDDRRCRQSWIDAFLVNNVNVNLLQHLCRQCQIPLESSPAEEVQRQEPIAQEAENYPASKSIQSGNRLWKRSKIPPMSIASRSRSNSPA